MKFPTMDCRCLACLDVPQPLTGEQKLFRDGCNMDYSSLTWLFKVGWNRPKIGAGVP